MKMISTINRHFSLYDLIFALMIFLSYGFKNYRFLLYMYEILFIVASLKFFYKKEIKRNGFVAWMVCFFLISVISIFYATNAEIAAKQAINILKGLMIAFFISQVVIVDRAKYFEIVMWTLLVSGVFIVVYIILVTPIKYLGQHRIGDEVNLNSNDLAMKLAFSCLACYYFFMKNKNRSINICLFFIFLVTMILTGSRKSVIFIGFCILLINFLYIKSNDIIKSVFKFLGLSFIVYLLYRAIFFFPILNNLLGTRLTNLIAIFKNPTYADNSTITRFFMIEKGFELFRIKPITGYGIANYGIIVNTSYSHNNYIELLVGVGIIGFLIYYSIYIVIIVSLFKKILSCKRIEFVFCFALIVGILIIEIGQVTYYTEIFLILLGTIYSISSSPGVVQSVVQETPSKLS